MAKGKVTESKIIDRKVYGIGDKLAKKLEPAIQSLDKILEMHKIAAISYAELDKAFAKSKGHKEYLEIKEREQKIRQETAKAIQEEKKAIQEEKKAKKEQIDLDKSAIQLKKAQEAAQKKTTKLTALERYEQNLLNKGKRRAALLSSKLSSAYDKQSTRLTILREKYKHVAIAEGEASQKALQLQKQIRKLDATLKRVDANVGQFQRNVGNYTQAMHYAKSAARELASAMGLVGGAFLVVQVIRDAVKRIREFDASMQNLAGIFRVSRADLRDLEDVIIDVASRSVKTSTEIANLAEALVTLGKTKDEVKQLLDPVTNLAIGLKGSADEVGEFLVQQLNAFGKGADAGRKFADVIATIRTSTSLDFQKMRDSFQYLSPISKLLNKDLAYTGALIGLVADNGLKAESSGRLLATAQQRLSKSGKTLQDGLKIINEAVKEGKTEIELLSIANGLFGAQAAKVGLILAANTDVLEVNAAKIRNNSGALDDLVNSQLKSLDAQIKILISSWERYILETNESTGVSKKLSAILKFVSSNLREIISTIGHVIKTYIAYKLIVRSSALVTSLMAKRALYLRASAIASAKGVNVLTFSVKKMNTAFKANAIGIAVIAFSSLIYILEKFNKSLEEQNAIVKKNNQSYFNQKKALEASTKGMDSMIERYKTLKDKTELSNEEQEELKDLMIKIAKKVPDAVTELGKYNKTVGISIGKVEEFNKKQKELLKLKTNAALKENRENYKKNSRELERLNKINEEGVEVFVSGVGVVKKYRDAYYKMIKQNSIGVKTTTKGNKLTLKEIELIEKKLESAKNAKEAAEDAIFAITGEKTASKEKRDAIEAEIKATEKKLKAQQDDIRSVENLRKEIKKLKEEQEKLTENDKVRAKQIAKDIEDKQKLIDKILQVNRAKKTARQLEKERLAKEKKLKEDAFKLSKFLLEQEVKLENEVLADKNSTLQARTQAVKQRAKIELKLAFDEAKSRLDLKKRFTEQEIETISITGQITQSVRNKANDEELLILEQYIAKRKQILLNKDNGIVEIEARELIRSAKIRRDQKEKELQDEIIAENELFLKKEGVYKNTEDALEKREKRIAAIKLKYAKAALKDQISAIEDLLKSDKLSAEKRAEYEKKLAEYKAKVSGLNVEKFKADNEVTLENERTTQEKIAAISNDLNAALGDLSASIFDNKIQNIETEIEAHEKKFDKLLEKEGLTEEERKKIETRREKEREVLEAKKRKEQRKQAIIEKALAITQAGINIALAITKVLANPFQVALVSSLGAIQMAAIVAKQIPKYAEGTEWHPGGHAWVGEGKRPDGSFNPETVFEPNKKPYVVDKPTLLDLPVGTRVVPKVVDTVDDFKKIYADLNRASILASVDLENQKIVKYHEAQQTFNTNYQMVQADNTRLENEIKALRKEYQSGMRELGDRITEAIEDNKISEY